MLETKEARWVIAPSRVKVDGSPVDRCEPTGYTKLMASPTDRYRIPQGLSTFSLASIDPKGSGTFDGDKKDAEKVFDKLNGRLEALQELLYADGRKKVLVVLQGMDTSGKDGTIRHIFDRTNPIGVKVASFKKPSSLELAHDYLWRAHSQVPASGEIVVFNRSHYEDVLVVRVDQLVPETRWQKRYQHIVDFERMLVDEGTTVLKFFLHISKDEQKERLEERLADPTKHWKFDKNDLAVRAKWDDYQRAYEDTLRLTSTPHAPWYVVPANKKWYRNLVISQVLIQTLESLGLEYPASQDLTGVTVT